MSKGAKIFAFSAISFCIVTFLVAFIMLNTSSFSALRSNETSSIKNINEDKVESNEPEVPENIDDVNDITLPTAPEFIPPVYTEISSYKTTIYDKEKNRIHNINLASDKLDGAIVKAGEEFSFNKTIGPMGANQGYKKATGFNGNGKKIKIYAGGMCQLSSTLYNAAMDSGFKITERHAHSRRVYYVPKNKDATVSYGGADLKFKNTTDTDIRISSTTDGHTVTIKIEKTG